MTVEMGEKGGVVLMEGKETQTPPPVRRGGGGRRGRSGGGGRGRAVGNLRAPGSDQRLHGGGPSGRHPTALAFRPPGLVGQR